MSDPTQLFQNQHGVASRAQLLKWGVPPRTITRRVASGKWAKVHAGVYRIAESLAPPEQIVLAGVLAVGGDAAASHRAAAWVHGFLGFETPIAEVSTTHPRQANGVLVHRVTNLRGDVTIRRGIRTTLPSRTIIDLADSEDAGVVEPALDDGLRRKILHLSLLQKAVDAMGTRGRRGAALVQRWINARNQNDARAESELETRFLKLIRAYGLPEPETQVKVFDGDRFLARIDFAYTELKMAMLLDGYGFHSSKEAFEHDRDQQNELVTRGWSILRFTWTRVNEDQAGVAAELLRMRASRVAQPTR